ncbi:MAG: hypothetical protein WCE68_14210 [Anaerolineales bacterium]
MPARAGTQLILSITIVPLPSPLRQARGYPEIIEEWGPAPIGCLIPASMDWRGSAGMDPS